MPLIKDQLETFEELAPFVKMTVAPNGVTVGDLAFVSAQTHWSSALATIATNDRVPGDLALDLWQTAQGETGQGYTSALTRCETSWLDSGGRLPANQCFVATACAFQVFLRSSQSTTAAGATITTLRNAAAVQAIGQAFVWDLTVGDGITRTIGSIGAYGGLGGISSAVPLSGVTVAVNQGGFQNITARQGAQGVFLGDACSEGVKLRVPLIFPPNINVRIKVRNGNSFDVQPYSDGASPAVAQNTLPTTSFLVVKQYLRGYLCTMPV